MADINLFDILRRIKRLAPDPSEIFNAVTSAITTTATTTIQAAPGAGKYLHVHEVLVTNSHATVGTFVAIYSGSGTRLLAQGYAAPAGGGFSATYPAQAPLRCDVNAILSAACGTSGANVIVSVSGRISSE